MNAKYRSSLNKKFESIDDLGNILVMNSHSRCGGLSNEWVRVNDAKQFTEQKLDGDVKRQNN